MKTLKKFSIMIMLSSVTVFLFMFFVPLPSLVRGVGFTVSIVWFLLSFVNVIAKQPIDKRTLYKKEKERVKYRNQSLSHIKSELLILLFLVITIWIIERFLFEIPFFLKVTILSVSVFALVQDILNVIYLSSYHRSSGSVHDI